MMTSLDYGHRNRRPIYTLRRLSTNQGRVWLLCAWASLVTLTGSSLYASQAEQCIAANPQGSLVAISKTRNTIELSQNDKSRETTVPGGAPVTSLVFAQNDTLLLAATTDGRVHIFNVSSGNRQQVIRAHEESISDLATSPDGTVFVTGTAGGSVKLWDAESFAELRSTVTKQPVTSLAALSRESVIIGQGNLRGGSLVQWETQLNQITVIDADLPGPPSSLQVHPQRMLIAGKVGDSIKFWDLEANRSRIYGGTAFAFRFSPDGRCFAIGRKGQVELHPLTEETVPQTLKARSEETNFTRVYFPAHDRVRARGEYEDSHWHIGSMCLPESVDVEGGQLWSVHAIDDSRAVVGGDRGAFVVDLKQGRVTRTLEGHYGGVRFVTSTPDGESILTGDCSGTIRIWSLPDLALQGTIKALPGGSVSEIVFTDNGETLVACSGSHAEISFWDWRTRSELHSIRSKVNTVTGVYVSPTGNKAIVVGAGTGGAFVHDTNSGSLLTTLDGHYSTILQLVTSPDGKNILTMGYDGKIVVRDANTLRVCRELEASRGGTCLAYSPDARQCAIGMKGELILVDSTTWQETARLPKHTHRIRGITYTPSGDMILTTSLDGTLKLTEVGLLHDAHVAKSSPSTKPKTQTLSHVGEARVSHGSLLASKSAEWMALTAAHRLWTDQTGEHKVDARYIRTEDRMAWLEKTDGTTLSVSLEDLSLFDRQAIRPLSLGDTQTIRNVRNAQKTQIGGPLPPNHRLTKEESPYLVVQQLEVLKGNTLTIEPGVVLLFEPNFSLKISGTLIARGTVDAPIVFTSAKKNPQPMDWRYVAFAEGSVAAVLNKDGEYQTGSVLQHCHIEYGKGVYIHHSSPLVDHCVIQDNADTFDGGGILVMFASPTISNCIVRFNRTERDGGGIRGVQAVPTIVNCEISYNSANHSGGGIAVDFTEARIEGNYLHHNFGFRGGAIATGEPIVGQTFNSARSFSRPHISGNRIVHNVASACGGGISVIGTPTILDNVIVANTSVAKPEKDSTFSAMGGGIYIEKTYGGPARIEENTIARNWGSSWGGGIYLKQSSAIIQNNSITRNGIRDGGGGGAICHVMGRLRNGGMGGDRFGQDISIEDNFIVQNAINGVHVAGKTNQTLVIQGGTLTDNGYHEVANFLRTGLGCQNNSILVKEAWLGTTNRMDLLERTYDHYDAAQNGRIILDALLSDPPELAKVPPTPTTQLQQRTADQNYSLQIEPLANEGRCMFSLEGRLDDSSGVNVYLMRGEAFRDNATARTGVRLAHIRGDEPLVVNDLEVGEWRILSTELQADGSESEYTLHKSFEVYKLSEH